MSNVSNDHKRLVDDRIEVEAFFVIFLQLMASLHGVVDDTVDGFGKGELVGPKGIIELRGRCITKDFAPQTWRATILR